MSGLSSFQAEFDFSASIFALNLLSYLDPSQFGFATTASSADIPKSFANTTSLRLVRRQPSYQGKRRAKY